MGDVSWFCPNQAKAEGALDLGIFLGETSLQPGRIFDQLMDLWILWSLEIVARESIPAAGSHNADPSPKAVVANHLLSLLPHTVLEV